MQLKSRSGYNSVADKELFNRFERGRCSPAFFTAQQSRFVGQFKGFRFGQCNAGITRFALQGQAVDVDHTEAVGNHSVISKRKTGPFQPFLCLNQAGIKLEEPRYIAGMFGRDAALRAGNLFALCHGIKGGRTEIKTAFAAPAYESGIIGEHAEPPQKINISNLF